MAQQNIETLYREHHGWVYQWLRHRLGCDYQAEDLAQDTFTRVLAGPETAIKEPRAFLTTIARGILVNWYRRQSLEQAYLDALAQLPEQAAPSEEQRYLILESLHEIDAMLDSLPLPVKHAFLLSQIEGLKYQDIASRLDVSLITVKRYMKQAFSHCLMVM
ncbi:sigma-70 family RNA polymerase sigma factor [Methylophaga sp. OBS4]|uniref:sigma-70 family RNA polymerase sigma factor n=1 Tax=Methylophaga sp. OBS4 TaxID=2991935 RepID=UPI00225B2370|nr:sigma-70 family RNA polymerase sigma factor [Methylophaga sp. OBS4]MCX4187973.1 sigma-70 family RNA polymerase sigma factor [Methylophaga sp. OBS4]